MNYIRKTALSRNLFEKARKYIPGGSAYAIRYFEPYPFYVKRALGSRIWDVDDNEYIDFWTVHFAAIFGHGYAPVMSAVKEQLDLGAHFGWCNEWEVKWAEKVCGWFRADKVKPANSGTESNMYAISLARAYTGKKKVGKMEGGWHGGFDGLNRAVNYPYNQPSNMNPTSTEDIIPLPFNDLDGLIKKVSQEELACITVEPMLGSAGAIPAKKEFLKGLREFCDKKSVVLIFDEVITGFRHPGGLQQHFGVKPDLTTMGKTVGGQYFAGAGGICGRSEIMDLLDQTRRKDFWERPAHGGTYVGNAVTMRAGYVTISELERQRDKVYKHIDSLGEYGRKRFTEIMEENRFEAYITGICSMFGLHFTKEIPINGETAERTKDKKLCSDLFAYLIQNGIAYLTPKSPHFAVSNAHKKEDLDYLSTKVKEFIKSKKER
ncbi:MAG: aminotransferase class III-fold pyridoxal phosphate-dependent enzyme [Nitrososphaeria archaeon]